MAIKEKMAKGPPTKKKKTPPPKKNKTKHTQKTRDKVSIFLSNECSTPNS